jgi:glycine hydroxymethyltransferase
VADAIAGELASQRRQLKLIASENYASPAVLLAMGNWLSDKYAEGTIGRRLYAGCEVVDRVESIAAGPARALFGAEHAYVQPHSGIDANLVAFWAILARRVEEPALHTAGVRHVNDLPDAAWQRLRKELHSQRMLGMALDAGGHLTHGFRPDISGKLFHQASYGQTRGPGCWIIARSPTKWARRSWWTWRTSPGWSRGACSPATLIRSHTPMW